MIGLIAAMSIEMENLCALASVREERCVSGIRFVTAVLDGKDVVLAVCGEGKVNAAMCAEAMILLYHPTLIINTGVAGGLSPTLRVPDVAIATSVVEHDYDISPLGYAPGEVLFPGGSATSFATDAKATAAMRTAAEAEGVHAELGPILSGDQFIADVAVKERLITLFHGIACEMEGGSIGHVCYLNKTPFAVLRAISDTADDGEKFDPVRSSDISIRLTRRMLSFL